MSLVVIGLAGKLYYIVLKVQRCTFKRANGRKPGHRGGVAQLGEHLLCKQGVIGSNPFISTNFSKGKYGSSEPDGHLRQGLIAQQVRAHA